MKNRRKAKLDSLSAAFTALFIAAVIVFNGVYSALASKFLWYVDMTEEQLFTLCDATKELLSDTDAPVTIYFTQEPSKLMSGEDSSEYMKYIYQTALQLQDEFDFINVQCVDIIKERNFFEPYYNSLATDIYTTSVIVESGTEFRVYEADAFFTWDTDYSSIWAYEGEYKFVSAILQVTASEMPAVYFTTQHGESIGSDASALTELFTDAGYDVREIDLTKEDFPDDTRIVVVNDPIYDFAGIEAGDSNEIAKLDTFLDNYGCLLVFTDADHSGNLTNLAEFLEEWGIGLNPGVTVKDLSNSLSVDGMDIVAKYEDSGLAASLYTDISALDTMPKTIVPNAMPLTLLWEEGGGLSGTRKASAIFSSYDSASLIQDGSEVDKGSSPLAILSREERVIDNNYYYSYVIACGSSEMCDSKYINSNTYANSDILYTAMRITGRERVLADIDFKVFDDTELDITTAQANRWTVLLCTLAPVVVAAAGIVVYIRRRYS
jgi:hypothetical protein